MAEWTEEYDLDGLDSDFLAIRSLFVSGHIKKMKQLEKQSPTKIASLLGLNYNSYHEKLKFPESFTAYHINLLAFSCRLDPNIIHNVIQAEIKTRVQAANKKYYDKQKQSKAKSLEK